MKNPTISFTTTKIGLISVLNLDQQAASKDFASISCLKWKLGKLFVNHNHLQNVKLAALENFQWSIDCLVHSCTRNVSIDLELGVAALQIWAKVCQKSKKSAIVRIPSFPRLPKKLYPLRWTLKCMLDKLVAMVLIIILSPALLFIALIVRLTSSGPVFSRHCCVGERGKLFYVLKFRTILNSRSTQYFNLASNQNVLFDTTQMTHFGRWLIKHKLDSTPQLINVIRGEMSIVGPTPQNLTDAVCMDINDRRCLRALPGMTGIIHQKNRNLLDIKSRCSLHFNYLNNWTLSKDVYILLKAILNY